MCSGILSEFSGKSKKGTAIGTQAISEQIQKKNILNVLADG
jgi:hypothetical protein